MIEIEIAGAGAGKTYGLAEKLLLSSTGTSSGNKMTYALTYTNKAKVKICETLINLHGFIPSNIQIDTVHGFLLNEIIYPYSKYILDEIYTKAVSIPLDSNIQFKQYKKNRLKEKQTIHNEDVFKKAKIIVDKENTRHNKNQKIKVEFVITHIIAITDKIFLDEVQDLDDDAFRIFEVLGIAGIPIYMIGDPKQAIKYPKAFDDFIFKCRSKNTKITNFLPINNNSRRIPEELLILSNRFCPVDQCQVSLSNIKGKAYYISSESLKYKKMIEQFVKDKYLVYIEEKEGNYKTHKDTKLYFPISVEEKLRANQEYAHLDSDLFINSILNTLTKQVQSHTKESVINNFTKKFKILLDKKEYAEFIQSLEKVISTKDGILVSSIDAVKGLESDRCVFILNQNTLHYFLQENLSQNNYHNKIWKKIYVALTRSSHEFIFALDKDLLGKQNFVHLIAKFEKMKITNYMNTLTI